MTANVTVKNSHNAHSERCVSVRHRFKGSLFLSWIGDGGSRFSPRAGPRRGHDRASHVEGGVLRIGGLPMADLEVDVVVDAQSGSNPESSQRSRCRWRRGGTSILLGDLPAGMLSAPRSPPRRRALSKVAGEENHGSLLTRFERAIRRGQALDDPCLRLRRSGLTCDEPRRGHMKGEVVVLPCPQEPRSANPNCYSRRLRPLR